MFDLTKNHSKICVCAIFVVLLSPNLKTKIEGTIHKVEVREIFELRKQGHVEEAYNLIRERYKVHHGKYTTLCMFWCASDVLQLRVEEGRTEDAQKILLALERMLPSMPDDDVVGNQMQRLRALLQEQTK